MTSIYKLATAMLLCVLHGGCWPRHLLAQLVWPSTPEVTNDTASVTLGVKFYSDVPGFITGVRFYKGSHNTGTHVGALWASSGTKLASVTFSGETASGWQQASFSTPISIVANATYVISYLAPRGYYACDQSYSWTAVSATPLHVSGTSPGVYAYGSTTRFPSGTWNRSNYWVDVMFSPTNPTPPAPTTTYTISGTVSGSPATLTLSGTPFAIDDNRRSGQLQVFRSIEWLVCRHAGAGKLHLLAVNGLGIDKQRVGCRCEFQRECCAHPDSAYCFVELDR